MLSLNSRTWISLKGRFQLVLFGCALLCTLVLAAKPVNPGKDERQALEQLGQRLSGVVVWESNRTGHWELYTMNTDGSAKRQLTHLAEPGQRRLYDQYLRPQVSPDGATILFGYGKAGAPCEVWTAKMSDGAAEKLTVGTPLNWSPDGSLIYFVRESQLWQRDFASAKESRVYNTRLPVDGRSGSMVGMLAPDLKSAVFRAPQRNEFVTLPDGKTTRTVGGCEPRFSADGRYMYWVNGPKDFRRWDLRTDKDTPLLGTPPVKPYNYTYFPTVTRNDRWLLYGASPGQHDHSKSDYEVYIQELRNWVPEGKPVRLTFDDRTDRWPFLHLQTSQPAPAADIATRRPGVLPVFMVAEEDAAAEFGGDWGLWPQLEGCRGTATFQPGADAEGLAGGAMRIDYDIRAKPNSFSLWITPGTPTVDMQAQDRVVVYAKGDVPSFTLVVKDRQATDPDAADGIADAAVKGVARTWQRFEIPFDRFVPRKKGSAVDWGSINHVGIALIAPADAPKGTLFVDNLRVERGSAATADSGKSDAATTGLVVKLDCADLSNPTLTNTAARGQELALIPRDTSAIRCTPEGIRIQKPTILASKAAPTGMLSSCRKANEITVTAWIRPARLDQQGPARILTLSQDAGQRDFTLGQERGAYVMRLRTTKTSTNGLPSLDSPSGMVRTEWTHLAYTRSSSGDARLYVDGRQVARANIAGSLQNWDDSYRLAIGNELTMDRPWLGDVHAVRVYSRALGPDEVTAVMGADTLATAEGT